MPRQARKESVTGYYHVTTRGINKEFIFNENREKARMLNLIQENYKKFHVQVFAYCVMQNHIHLLVQSEKEDLSAFMAKILAKYAKYYNFKHQRVGYVFQGRFHSQCIESEEHFWNCLRYIHLNPLKAKMCRKVEEYRYSSASLYLDPERCKKSILSREGYAIHAEALEGQNEFHRFHQGENVEIFVDTPEEEFMQQKEIARKILENMSKDFGLIEEEVLDYCRTRDLFENILINKFHGSKRKVKTLRKILQEEMRRK